MSCNPQGGKAARPPEGQRMDALRPQDLGFWSAWWPTAARALRAVRIASDLWWLVRRGWALFAAEPDLLDLFAGA